MNKKHNTKWNATVAPVALL